MPVVLIIHNSISYCLRVIGEPIKATLDCDIYFANSTQFYRIAPVDGAVNLQDIPLRIDVVFLHENEGDILTRSEALRERVVNAKKVIAFGGNLYDAEKVKQLMGLNCNIEPFGRWLPPVLQPKEILKILNT